MTAGLLKMTAWQVAAGGQTKTPSAIPGPNGLR